MGREGNEAKKAFQAVTHSKYLQLQVWVKSSLGVPTLGYPIVWFLVSNVSQVV